MYKEPWGAFLVNCGFGFVESCTAAAFRMITLIFHVCTMYMFLRGVSFRGVDFSFRRVRSKSPTQQLSKEGKELLPGNE